MSLGRTSTFLDIYAERDLREGRYTEAQVQEFVDHFIMKLRLVKFARTPEYNDLFSGDPTWVTESIGGIGIDGRHMVTKMSYRYLHALHNLGTAPEPNPVSYTHLLPGHKSWEFPDAAVPLGSAPPCGMSHSPHTVSYTHLADCRCSSMVEH